MVRAITAIVRSRITQMGSKLAAPMRHCPAGEAAFSGTADDHANHDTDEHAGGHPDEDTAADSTDSDTVVRCGPVADP
jgi:hypothetical protein